MAKRGRPLQFGAQPGVKLIETIEAFYEYTQARRHGAKYEGAVLIVVRKFKAIDPHWRTSRSSDKRMINAPVSKKYDAQLRITKYCDPSTGAEVTGIGFEPFQHYKSRYAK